MGAKMDNNHFLISYINIHVLMVLILLYIGLNVKNKIIEYFKSFYQFYTIISEILLSKQSVGGIDENT